MVGEADVSSAGPADKWNAFLANPSIRPILGQSRSTIDFGAIINQGKWLLVNVSRDKLKESRRLMGALIVTLMHQAALAREDVPPAGRIFHALWVDEFEASRQRKYGVRGWRSEEQLKVAKSEGGLPRAEIVEHPRLKKPMTFLPDAFFELDLG